MHITTNYIVFPEGDLQEIGGALRVNQVVDLNGNPLPLPLPTPRMIAYRVFKISSEEKTGVSNRFHHVELLTVRDLQDFL